MLDVLRLQWVGLVNENLESDILLVRTQLLVRQFIKYASISSDSWHHRLVEKSISLWLAPTPNPAMLHSIFVKKKWFMLGQHFEEQNMLAQSIAGCPLIDLSVQRWHNSKMCVIYQ